MNKQDISHFSSGAYGYVTPGAELKNYTTFHIGGPCQLLIEPTCNKELLRSVRCLRSKGIPFIVIGNGSNLLVSDKGYEGAMIRLNRKFSDAIIDGTRVTAQAGASLTQVALLSFKASLTGMERVGGIPGTVGGAIAMNAGAYGREMSQLVESIKVIDQEGQLFTVPREELDFAYRHSIVSDQHLLAVEVNFQLEEGDKGAIEQEYQEFLDKRRKSQPLDQYSAGSTFKRPAGDRTASQLIDQAGLKGLRVGDAQVSEKHAGFLINRGDATAQDMLTLIREVERRVYESFGIQLETEVKLVGWEQ